MEVVKEAEHEDTHQSVDEEQPHKKVTFNEVPEVLKVPPGSTAA